MEDWWKAVTRPSPEPSRSPNVRSSVYVAYVLPGLTIGGGVNVVLEHAERLARRGHRVAVLSTEDRPTVTWRGAEGLELVSIHDVGEMLDAFVDEPDVLVATGWQTVYEIAWRRLPAKSYGYFVQAFEPDFYDADSFDADLAATTYTLPFSYLTEATWIQARIRTQYGHEVAYARNGLNDHFHISAKPNMPRSDRFRILLEGPLDSPRKRMDDAFLAVQGLDAEVWLVTSGGELAPWQKPDRVFREVPLSVMPSIYASCHAMVKLSSVEGMFGPPLEMMSQGGVPVTSDVAGHEEFMRNGVNGFVVPIGDWVGARSALERLMSNPTLWEDMSHAGRETAQEFVWEPTVDVVESWLTSTAYHQTSSVGADLFRLARLGTRVYMNRAWNVGSLDGPQRLHAKLEFIPANATPSRKELIITSGWIASKDAASTWKLDATIHHVLNESWRDRPDVLEVMTKHRSAVGFGLTLLTTAELSGSPTVSFVSVGNQRREAVLDPAQRQSRDKGIYVDEVRRIPCLSISHPVAGDEDLRLEVWGAERGDLAPRAFVELHRPHTAPTIIPVEALIETGVQDKPVWFLEGLTVQRFLGDPTANLLIGSSDFEPTFRWTKVQ